MGMNDINSLAHTKWNCKYHIVFAPKYRRKVFYQEKREAVGKILRRLCEWKGVYREPAKRGQNGWATYHESVRPVYGRQVTILRSWQTVLTRLTRARGTWGFARISKTTRLAGGCLFISIRGQFLCLQSTPICPWQVLAYLSGRY